MLGAVQHGMVQSLAVSAHPFSRAHSLTVEMRMLPIPTPWQCGNRAVWRVVVRTMLVLLQCTNSPCWCTACVLMH